MLIFLISALLCTVVSSSGYEDSNEYESPETFDGYNSGKVLEGPVFPSLTPAGDRYGSPKNDGYGVPEKNDYYSPKDGQCRKIRQLSISGHRTARAKFFKLERNGKTYTTISCPNSGKPYALVAAKEGADTTFNFGPAVVLQDTVLLTTGFNIDFAVRCSAKRTVAKAYNGRKVSIKKVACVQLPQPTSINQL